MTSAVIVAAGKSARMGAGVDKLFLEVNGRPLVSHTWRTFDSCARVDEIIIVVRDGTQASFNDLAGKLEFKKQFHVVAGGKERQDSVWNGLDAISPACEIVVIQDAARPCTTERLIADTIQAAREVGAAVAAQRVTDTIKESDGGTMIQRTIDRARLWAVQTPQTFQAEVIRRALAAVRERGLMVTDDTAACELIGQPVKLVESLSLNPKVTSLMDLPLIEMLLRGVCSA